jgi:zinc protease
MLSADLATPDQSSTNQNKQVDTQAMPDVPTLIIQKTIRRQAEPAK